MSYRIIPPRHVVELTTRVEQGLLLPANPLVKLFIEAAMARAQELHPITICHYLTESTHIHMVLVVNDPCDIRDFAERFKTESAHYINKMLGRKKRTVWCEGYFCAPILTESVVRKKISYIYTNPAKDLLEDTISQYPNLSSWRAYRSGRYKRSVPRVSRTVVPYMPNQFYSKHVYSQEARKVKKLCKERVTLIVQPDAWMEIFSIPEEERAEQNSKIIELIEEEEQFYREKREKEGKTVIGQQALSAAHLETEYLPQKHGKSVWCISDDKDLRIRYIEWAKALKEKAREVYERWKVGDFSQPYPPGVFAPTRPLVANLSPVGTEY